MITASFSSQAKLAGVMGFPVAHSRSPLLHNYWLQHYALDGVYVPLAVHPNQLEKALRGLAALGFAGCNITLPHKEAALPFMDHLDPLARAVGAVNTVIVRDDGTLEGRNTDVYGFTRNLESAGKAWKKKKPALVLGAGGAARAIIVALLQEGCPDVRLANRTTDRARALRDSFDEKLRAKITLVGWPDREEALDGAALVVNTTTQGMEGQEALALDLRKLEGEALVTDLVYTPLLTPLLLEARRRGHVIVDGLGMLLHQATPGFAAWFGRTPDVTPALRQRVEASLYKKG